MGRALLCAARTAEALDGVVREITAASGKAASLPLDLAGTECRGPLVDFAVKTFGGLDIVVNNAGATRRGAFVNLTDEDWSDSFALKFSVR